MDTLAHALWAGSGLVAVNRRRRLDRTAVVWTLVLAVLPDFLHNLPVIAWAASDGTIAAWKAYAIALPGQEPQLPGWAAEWSHQLHCLAHSAVVAAIVSALLFRWRSRVWLPLLGWWSHIVIDIFTHSADFYPAPVLYPLNDWRFDGVAWNTPWFTVLNYATLVFVWLWLNRRRSARRR